jgi:hypothetical protein
MKTPRGWALGPPFDFGLQGLAKGYDWDSLEWSVIGVNKVILNEMTSFVKNPEK